MLQSGRYYLDKVIVFGRHCPGVVGGLVNEHLTLAKAGALRAIYAKLVMDAAEQVVGMEQHVKTEARGRGAAVFASFDADARVIEDLALVINHGARGLVVAHHVEIVVHPVRVIRPHHQPNIVETVSGGEAVIYLVKRARICASSREGGPGAETVCAFDVELDYGAGDFARDLTGIVES